jgi:hypothetical protein
MAKVYDSSETNEAEAARAENVTIANSGHKGGATASARRGDESPVVINDYTGTTSEKSSARYLVPLIIALIVIGCFLALRGRYSPATGSLDRAGTNPATAPAAGQDNGASR